MDEGTLDLRIIAAEPVIDSIEERFAASGVPITRSRIVDPSYLGLDLSTVADLAAVVSLAVANDPLLPLLWQWLHGEESGTRIVVETPLGRAVFDSREELSEEEVREKLARIVGLFS